MKRNVYLASPWFNPDQNRRMEEVLETIKKSGMTVFAPKYDSQVNPAASKKDRRKSFETNVREVINSDIVVAITNEKDMGTIFEAGVAYSNNVPIVYFAEGLEGGFNLMLAESAVAVTSTTDELADVLNYGETVEETLDHLKAKLNIDESVFDGEIE